MENHNGAKQRAQLCSLQPYSRRFYDTIAAESLGSARIVVPIIVDLLRPTSVIDVGCGTGNWLKAFREAGIETIRGIDGSWVDRSSLVIPQEWFSHCDLRQPFQLPRRFDLAVSLEVAEHLPPQSARTFVEGLVGLADAIVFSAAIPFQGGTNHLNEQWPDYWVDLFRENQYALVDCLRGRIWHDEQVAWWYRQNMLLFVKMTGVDDYSERLKIQPKMAASPTYPISIVHPTAYLARLDLDKQLSGRTAVRLAARVVLRALRQRIRRLFIKTKGQAGHDEQRNLHLI